MKQLIITYLFVLSALVQAQQIKPITESELQESYRQRDQLAVQSLLKNYPVRNIGPSVQGGRITDIDVNLQNPKEFYVAYASGGIFRTRNNGISFEPIFDEQGALGIGDFALAPSNPNIMYVGTGENNSSRSSYAGNGVYKTMDGGKTWQHLGLVNTQHIGKVIVHPQNPDVVWVASIGALYSNNIDRGVYKSNDGGKTWKKTLYINDSTGVIDLVINPQNPNQLWASSWERTRKANDFKGSGPGSAIYRSDNGGESWFKVVDGFPQGPQVGRIGLAVAENKPNIVYAFLDNQAEVPVQASTTASADVLTAANFSKMTKEDFLKLDNKKLDAFLRSGFPAKYTAESVKKDVRNGKYEPAALSVYFGDANAALFNSKIVGAELYRSDDSGTTWKKMNSYDLDGIYFTYGYYFGEVRVSPADENKVYIFGVPLLKSNDGGVTFHRIDTVGNVHVDHQALWINPKDPEHIILGNDGGLYISYDEGAIWSHINNMPVGQFYTVNVDMETPYNVYGGLQDNGVLTGPSRAAGFRGATRDWEAIMGGDGMYVAPDPRNSKLVYTGFQFGNYFRINRANNQRARITPSHDIGEPVLRWNWRTPLILSSHNPDIVYMAAQRVYRSMNKGDNWEAISPDLTKDKPQGNVPFSTISTLAESNLKFGLIYAGSDDGNLCVTKNAGGSWERIDVGLPQDRWISSVFPSPHEEATVFVSLNGYRYDEFKTYLFMSKDYGKTWTSVKGNLPESVANVIVQDPVNPSILYCGLDMGTFTSLDGGTTWHLFNQALNVASYDMLVHPRDHELVIGTHGRSIFVADVKPLHAVSKAGINKGVLAFKPEAIRFNERWGQQTYGWSPAFEPTVALHYYVGKQADNISIEIYDDKNVMVRKLTTSGNAGFNRVNWDVKISAPAPAASAKKGKGTTTPATELKYAGKGKYKIKFINGAESAETEIEIR
jgi:photosystem II stability/assembly factor-like uncharacterized protein